MQLELQRKLLELDERYAVDARLAPVALLRTTVQVLAVKLAVQRKTAIRTHTTYWNPLLKQFEPFACHRCGTSGFTVGFSNETVEPLCMECLNH